MSEQKYPNGYAFRTDDIGYIRYRVLDYNDEAGTYKVVDSRGLVSDAVEEVTLDDTIPVDFETGLAEDEMRVGELRLLDRFTLCGESIVWKVVSLGPVKQVKNSFRGDRKTRIEATHRDRNTIIRHTFKLNPGTIILKV